MTAQEWNHPQAHLFLEAHIADFIHWKKEILSHASNIPKDGWELVSNPWNPNHQEVIWNCIHSLIQLGYLMMIKTEQGPRVILNNS